MNMLLAMGMAACLCLLTGIFPGLLYNVLPFAVDFHPYETGHVVATLQLLILTLAAFWLYIDKIMAGGPAVTLDTDWFYRMFGRGVFRFCNVPLQDFSRYLDLLVAAGLTVLSSFSTNPYGLFERFKRAPQDVAETSSLTVKPSVGDNDHRFPIGWGICASALFLFCYGMVYLIMP